MTLQPPHLACRADLTIWKWAPTPQASITSSRWPNAQTVQRLRREQNPILSLENKWDLKDLLEGKTIYRYRFLHGPCRRLMGVFSGSHLLRKLCWWEPGGPPSFGIPSLWWPSQLQVYHHLGDFRKQDFFISRFSPLDLCFYLFR